MENKHSSLINDVKKLVKEYQEKNVTPAITGREANYKSGCDELFELIKSVIPEKVKTYAGYGRSEARVFEFRFKDEIKFDNCFAKDLLTKGDVVQRLQFYLDTEHSDENGPAFFVYFTHIGRFQKEPTANKFGVFVNWDKSSWPALKERLNVKPNHGRPQTQTQHRPNAITYRTRGGLHISRNERENVPVSEPSSPKDELPESHNGNTCQ
uniref:Uncharacterized protein n=1 Tax=viral metagenome TaxID=1070528 RepID=A0A6C0BKB3_9ZZZZ